MCRIYSKGKIHKTKPQADKGQETRREWWRRKIVNRSRHCSVQSRCISMSARSVLWQLQTRHVGEEERDKNKVFGGRRTRCFRKDAAGRGDVRGLQLVSRVALTVSEAAGCCGG